MSWSAWGEAFRGQRLPYFDVELQTRLEMAALYAATADAATGLRVFNFTGRAVVELLAIALDARRAIDPPQRGSAWGWARGRFDRENPADDLQERLRAMDPQVIPPIVTTTAEQLVAAVSMSDPDQCVGARTSTPNLGGGPISIASTRREELPLPDGVSTRLCHEPRGASHCGHPGSPLAGD
jgi:hypothetical protein